MKAVACALALALVVALGPIVLPWYALWAVVLIAAAGSGIERLITTETSLPEFMTDNHDRSVTCLFVRSDEEPAAFGFRSED